ncbi:hypothetical protein D3C86_1545920 [compost metagenome]
MLRQAVQRGYCSGQTAAYGAALLSTGQDALLPHGYAGRVLLLLVPCLRGVEAAFAREFVRGLCWDASISKHGACAGLVPIGHARIVGDLHNVVNLSHRGISWCEASSLEHG